MDLGRVWAKVNPFALRVRRRADIVALGDSNTLIGYLPPWSRDRWTSIVGREAGAKVLNLGRDGATLHSATEAGDLDRALRARPADVLIGYVVNDSNRTELEDYEQQVRATVAAVKAAGARAWLVTGVWLDYPEHFATDRRNQEMAPFNATLRDLAAELDAGLIDVAERMRAEAAAGNWDLRIRNGALDDRRDAGKTDTKWWSNVHLSVAGCRVVAAEVVAAMETAKRPAIHEG